MVKKDNGALQVLEAGDALIEGKFMPVDGGFRVEEQFKQIPSTALNRWYSSYVPGFANTWNYPPVGGLVAKKQHIIATLAINPHTLRP